MGFIVLGLFAMNSTGIEGASIQMINHGITTGALFACVGIVYERYHTREMSELSGLWDRLPILAFFLILASLGSAAVPGLNGFIGEFPILAGMFARNPTAAILASFGMVLGAYYLLWMLQRVVFGPLKEPGGDGHGHGQDHAAHDGGSHGAVRPVGWHEIAGLAPLMVLIVVMGVFPRPFLSRMKPSLEVITAPFLKMDARKEGCARPTEALERECGRQRRRDFVNHRCSRIHRAFLTAGPLIVLTSRQQGSIPT